MAAKRPSTGMVALALGLTEAGFAQAILAGFDFSLSHAYGHNPLIDQRGHALSKHADTDIAILRAIQAHRGCLWTSEPAVQARTGIPLLPPRLTADRPAPKNGRAAAISRLLMFFDYGQALFRYTPFPIGIAKPVMPDARYGELVANFPPVELFESFEQMGKKGRKFTLSAKENQERYDDFVQGNPLWREFHRWIKSRDFVYGALEMLAAARDRPGLPLRAAGAARGAARQGRWCGAGGCRATCRWRRASSSRPCPPTAATCRRTPTRPPRS